MVVYLWNIILVSEGIFMNLKIEALKQQLIQIIGSSNLPVGVILYLLKDLYTEIELLYQEQIQIEEQQLKQQDTMESVEPIQGFTKENNEVE